MIYAIPKLEPYDHKALELLKAQREQLRFHVARSPNRWIGSLRRAAAARALRGSNSIEGYNAELDQAAVIVDDEKPETLEEETYKALVGYRTSMTYILRMHDDPHFALDAQVIRSIHFMMLSYDLTKLPGQWRTGSIFVVQEPSGETVYEGPDANIVASLVEDLEQQLAGQELGVDPLVIGAMAHLNLAMIHPFKDGNGRMSRALQTLIISRNGMLSPVFCSIEEWLGRNTQAYYNILAEVGQGKWNPHHNALPWVRFCLRAHYQQAATLMRRISETGAIWGDVVKLIERHSLHTRSETSLVEAALGFTIRNSRYRQEGDISDVVASRDLKKLCEIGLLIPVGDKRGRHYIASSGLAELRKKHAQPRREEDLYDLVHNQKILGGEQLTLSLGSDRPLT